MGENGRRPVIFIQYCGCIGILIKKWKETAHSVNEYFPSKHRHIGRRLRLCVCRGTLPRCMLHTSSLQLHHEFRHVQCVLLYYCITNTAHNVYMAAVSSGKTRANAICQHRCQLYRAAKNQRVCAAQVHLMHVTAANQTTDSSLKLGRVELLLCRQHTIITAENIT